ncbi:unnamed protein product [Nesidiocoris tenuis]|uniref:Major facilitator superfamily (MFS) profile domain-containing protein n=1 Tax=Nesidiocoris tenuis TaxID=355587 RepID=A0A6H5HQN2_9HEMI|nr:unnamed protein product [Nesidiocoris tenuis]
MESPSPTKNRSSALPAYLMTLAATLLVFCGGTELGWSSPAIMMYDSPESEAPMHPTDRQESWIGSLLTLGALMGALPAGKLADVIGRKPTLMIIPFPLMIAWGIIYATKSVMWVCAARLIGGVALGAMGTVIPMYVSEIAEDSNRGLLCTFYELMLTSGILFTYTVSYFASYRILALSCAVPTAVFLFAFAGAPETPLYCLKKKQRKKAEQALRSLRGKSYDPEEELQSLEGTLKQPTSSMAEFFRALRTKEAVTATIISLGLMTFQQITGVNIVVFYLSKIFNAAGTKLDTRTCTVGVGFAQVVANILSVSLVDKLGRKFILQISAGIMGASLAILGCYFLKKDNDDDVSPWGLVPVIAVLFYMVAFEFSWGTIPWTMCGEVLPDNIKGVVFGISVCLNWSLAFLTINVFLILVDKIGNANTYWLMSSICALAALFATFVVIEMKGKCFHQIQDELEEGNLSI